MRILQRISGLLVLTLLAAMLCGLGCSSDVRETLAPEELYRRAVEDFEDKDFPEAAKWAQQLREEYPFSPLASEAELLEADIYFARKDYLSAAAAYQAFEELHPTHKRVDYAMLRRGLAYAEDIPDVDRDQTPSRNAAIVFARLLANYPDSEHAPEVREKLTHARNQLAGHEIYVARYYIRKDEDRAAMTRLQVVVQEFSDTSYGPEAMKMALELQARLDQEKMDEETGSEPEQE